MSSQMEIITPTSLRALYNVGSATGLSNNNSVAIASFGGDFYDSNDLEDLWKKYDIEPCKVTNVPSDQPSGYGKEAELDTQYMSSMGEKIPMTVWYTEGLMADALMEWTINVLNETNPPLLFSVSYGGDEQSFGRSYISRFNTNLAAMGSRGITVLFASGDFGAGGGCQIGKGPFEPAYPASSPYVTAVGGVTGGTQGQQPLNESVWIRGGGGFSNYSPIQSWQKSAVESYLTNTNGLPNATLYNATGRGYPDISAQSVNFIIVVHGIDKRISGTSCSSPSVGGIFGLLNDLRLNAGQQPFGFLNPFIYQTVANDSSVFNDVTQGYNRGCINGSNYVTKAFPATIGWDAGSGYGSPNYAKLKTYALNTGKKTIKYSL